MKSASDFACDVSGSATIATLPISSYGRSKPAIEWMYGIQRHRPPQLLCAALLQCRRADPAGRSGRSTREEFHLIHVAVQAALVGGMAWTSLAPIIHQQTDPAFVTMCTLPISRRRMSMR
jgi:hypothetical protein